MKKVLIIVGLLFCLSTYSHFTKTSPESGGRDILIFLSVTGNFSSGFGRGLLSANDDDSDNLFDDETTTEETVEQVKKINKTTVLHELEMFYRRQLMMT